MKNKSMSILKMTGAAAALVLMFAQPVLADGSFANGTSVNGVAVGGMSNEEAKAKLEQNYGSYKLSKNAEARQKRSPQRRSAIK